MKPAIFPDAKRLERVQQQILFRRELLELGETTEAELRRLVAASKLTRIANGAYVLSEIWAAWYPGERLLAATLAQARINRKRAWVFTHESAAAIWNLPLWNLRSTRVHVATAPETPARSSARVKRRLCRLQDDDVVERSGLRFTTLARTMTDIAISTPPELAIGVVDAGLRALFAGDRAVGDRTAGVELAREWQAEQLATVMQNARPGVQNAREVIAMADPRADSPAESVSRLHLRRLGIEHDIQVPIEASGRTFWADFEFLGQNVYGEVDGNGKYVEQAMRGSRSPEQVVLAEKVREDEIRGVTGKRVVRWQVQHLRTARTLGERLKRFGLIVPRLER